MNASPLPIDDVTDSLASALANGKNCVLVAPPGAGKTTRLPLALRDQSWLDGGRIIVVQPRRLAALGAARRMASELGEVVGQTIGHRVRFDTKVSADTRIELVTDGVFVRMILGDPELTGTGLVLFDEVHERALAADMGLAFALEAQAVLRPDLRLVAMSATVDGAKFEQLLGQHKPCVHIESKGIMFPIQTHHIPIASSPLDGVVKAAENAVRDFSGDGLVFLPGQREIEEAAQQLRSALGEKIAVHALYAAASRQDQEAALRRDASGRRKLVVASSIAQTSLTIPGVRFVVDSGLARYPLYDPVRGVTRLHTRQASRAAIDQRRGRAGREAPGHCVRLWRREEEGGRPPQDRPEILDADLASARLDMAVWGATRRQGLSFLEPPPQSAWGQAGALLMTLGALKDDGTVTDLGKRIARQPTHPRLAAMMEQAGPDATSDAAWAAVAAGELDTHGPIDASARLRQAMREPAQAKRLKMVHARLSGLKKTAPQPATERLVQLLLLAYPDRVAKRQRDDGQTATYKLAQGMQVCLEAHQTLAQEPFLLVLDMGGGRQQNNRGNSPVRLPNVRLALPFSEHDLYAVLGARMHQTENQTFEPKDWSVRVRHEERLGSLCVREEARPRLSGIDALDQIATHIRQSGLRAVLGSDKHAAAIAERYESFLRNNDGTCLMDRLGVWLPALLASSTPPTFPAGAIQAAFRACLDWNEQQAFDAAWPPHIVLGEGRKATIRYDHPAGPAISVRPQWLYGFDSQPQFGPEKIQLLVELISPANRPIQTTGDLPGFWRGAWADVRKEMRARYPKHNWPEKPWEASPPQRSPKNGD